MAILRATMNGQPIGERPVFGMTELRRVRPEVLDAALIAELRGNFHPDVLVRGDDGERYLLVSRAADLSEPGLALPRGPGLLARLRRPEPIRPGMRFEAGPVRGTVVYADNEGSGAQRYEDRGMVAVMIGVTLGLTTALAAGGGGATIGAMLILGGGSGLVGASLLSKSDAAQAVEHAERRTKDAAVAVMTEPLGHLEPVFDV